MSTRQVARAMERAERILRRVIKLVKLVNLLIGAISMTILMARAMVH